MRRNYIITALAVTVLLSSCSNKTQANSALATKTDTSTTNISRNGVYEIKIQACGNGVDPKKKCNYFTRQYWGPISGIKLLPFRFGGVYYKVGVKSHGCVLFNKPVKEGYYDAQLSFIPRPNEPQNLTVKIIDTKPISQTVADQLRQNQVRYGLLDSLRCDLLQSAK